MSHTPRHIPKVPVAPTLPQPYGDKIDVSYITQLVRAIELTLTSFTEIGALRGGSLYLTRLPTNGNGLRAGEVYADGGFLKIADGTTGYAPSLAATAEISSVSVSTS